MSIDEAAVEDARRQLNNRLLKARNIHGWWTGELSTSALSTATAVMALHLAARTTPDAAARERWLRLQRRGLDWLIAHQNDDGGWGDTVLSLSNIATTMLVHSVLLAAEDSSPASFKSCSESVAAPAIDRAAAWIQNAGGVPALKQRYGKDHTFSVPILTHCALAGTVGWNDVMPLPFELACVPHRWYAAVRMPVVSYALPALIAIGQVIFRNRPPGNPFTRLIRRAAVEPSLRVLESLQPENGGFLEATPLTSFVCMSLLGCGLTSHPVTVKCLSFLEASVREDGSWPIDTNLATWVTTLSVNALSAGPVSGVPAFDTSGSSRTLRDWLLGQQFRTVHPYTHAAPGGWSWTDLPGGVPDADDTPGAILALLNLRNPERPVEEEERQALRAGILWLLDLQNRDGGWPTFCRGWGTLPFDRSSNDLTAHVLRAFHRWRCEDGIHAESSLRDRVQSAISRGVRFLEAQQAADGTWLPLWFGHQHHQDDQNPLYGTSRVVLALAMLGRSQSDGCRRAVAWLLANQNDDGGWSARRGLESSVEETGLAVESLAGFPEAAGACDKAAVWLAGRVGDGTISQPSPIGFYFARLWYFESLYPIIFAVAGLNRRAASRQATEPKSKMDRHSG